MRMLTQCAELRFNRIRDRQIWQDMSVFVQRLGHHIIRVWLSALLFKGPPYKQCSHGNEGIMHVLSVEVWVILKVIVLRTKVLRVGKQAPGICPRCRKGNLWAKVCKSKPGILGHLLPGNKRRGQPQAPTYPQKTAYGAMNLLPSQRDQFLNLSGQNQEVQDWTSVPPPTQY